MIPRQLATAAAVAAVVLLTSVAIPAADNLRLPVLAPVTGVLSIEGTSQRNGAMLALEHVPGGVAVDHPFFDTGSSPQVAVQAFQKAMRGGTPVAVSASIFGPEMLAMMPLAKERGVPLITVSGTGKITRMGNPWVFRFFPSDAVVKKAQARYTVNELGKHRIALVYQTTAYGQSGRKYLKAAFDRLGVEVVFEEGLDVSVRDFLPVLTKIADSGADAIVLQLHSGPTARFVKQAASSGSRLPIVAGSAMHQPSTAKLLEPAELEGVCAESGSSPVSEDTPRMAAFTKAYRTAFDAEPDAFAAGQYDGINMVLKAIAAGAHTPDAVRRYLASTTYRGVAMTYRSDGHGDMAHDAVIVCYDGKTRTPAVMKRYHDIDGAL